MFPFISFILYSNIFTQNFELFNQTNNNLLRIVVPPSSSIKLIQNIEKITNEERVQNIYMCKNNEYKDNSITKYNIIKIIISKIVKNKYICSSSDNDQV